jgi:uncharacterized protein (TIGR01244 family)
MTEFRKVTDDFSVAGQIALEDVDRAATEGFKLLINNRPDGEVPGQPTSHELEAAAHKAGMIYAHIPISGMPTREAVHAEQAMLAEADGPALAFCRSGNRSILTWSIGQAISGERSRVELIELAAGAGYDLSGVLG